MRWIGLLLLAAGLLLPAVVHAGPCVHTAGTACPGEAVTGPLAVADGAPGCWLGTNGKKLQVCADTTLAAGDGATVTCEAVDPSGASTGLLCHDSLADNDSGFYIVASYTDRLNWQGMLLEAQPSGAFSLIPIKLVAGVRTYGPYSIQGDGDIGANGTLAVHVSGAGGNIALLSDDGGAGVNVNTEVNLVGPLNLSSATLDGPSRRVALCDLVGAPTCGTGCATIVTNSGNCVGAVTTSTLATSVTVNWSAARAQAPFCTCTDSSTASFCAVTSVSTSSVTFGLSAGLTGTVTFHCLLGG